MDKQTRYEALSVRMMKLQEEARSQWNAGNEDKALDIADVISKIADVRLKYIYQ